MQHSARQPTPYQHGPYAVNASSKRLSLPDLGDATVIIPSANRYTKNCLPRTVRKDDLFDDTETFKAAIYSIAEHEGWDAVMRCCKNTTSVFGMKTYTEFGCRKLPNNSMNSPCLFTVCGSTRKDGLV